MHELEEVLVREIKKWLESEELLKAYIDKPWQRYLENQK